ncbi:hypothetical protein BH18ACI5_BH18ACI5_04280 [soil metagenome]
MVRIHSPRPIKSISYGRHSSPAVSFCATFVQQRDDKGQGLSASQIDRLGERLKGPDASEADIRLLDEYRRLFVPAYELVVSSIRERLSIEASGRPAKTLVSIREKLRRETIRLSQMQDIAGCRVVVPDLRTQRDLADSLPHIFEDVVIVDRCSDPSHGYRAIHGVVLVDGKRVEVQIRTHLQHRWAEIAEKASDRDPGIKYGHGKARTMEILLRLSDTLFRLEHFNEHVRLGLTSPVHAAGIQDLQRLFAQLLDALSATAERGQL